MIDKEEIKKVSDTIEIVKSNIEEYEILYSNLLKENADEQYIQNMSKIYSNKLKNLNNAVSVPYFARVDFKEDKQNNIQKYILEKQVYLMMTTKLLLLIGEHQFQVFIMMVNWEM